MQVLRDIDFGAGLLQIYARTPRYASHSIRLASFQLSSASPTDEPSKAGSLGSPSASSLLHHPPQTAPSAAFPIINRQPLSPDLSPTSPLLVFPNEQPNPCTGLSTSCPPGFLEISAPSPPPGSQAPAPRPSVETMAPLCCRGEVYPSAHELALAGFFSTGRGDETVCPACGLGLRDWQPTDQPVACHAAYAMAAGFSTATLAGAPSLPCLYIAVHRLLTSELPLTRKQLITVSEGIVTNDPPRSRIQGWRGRTESLASHMLPGVIDQPTSWLADDNWNLVTALSCGRRARRQRTTSCGLPDDADEQGGEVGDNDEGYPSLADRLRAIYKLVGSVGQSAGPQIWPVQNARSLGHSDDLIVLALWRMQQDAAKSPVSFPPAGALQVNPQATADLLRAILRVQEAGLLDDEDEENIINPGMQGVILPTTETVELLQRESLTPEDQSHEREIRIGNVRIMETGPLGEDTHETGVDASQEDEEAAAYAFLPRCTQRRLELASTTGPQVLVTSDQGGDSDSRNEPRGIIVPKFFQFLKWWADKWPNEQQHRANMARAPPMYLP